MWDSARLCRGVCVCSGLRGTVYPQGLDGAGLPDNAGGRDGEVPLRVAETRDVLCLAVPIRALGGWLLPEQTCL